MRPAVNHLGEILSFGIWMEKEGYKLHTVRGAVNTLKSVARRTDILNAERVKEYLASAKLTDTRKEIIATHAARFYKWKQIAFNKPRYSRPDKLPWIPLENDVDLLIGGLGKKSSCFVQLIKETGCRPGEAWQIRWMNINFEQSHVTIVPEKGSRARQLKVSSRLSAMLNEMPKNSAYVFHKDDQEPVKSLDYFRRVFDRQRLKIAQKLENPRIRLISFKALRHFEATMEYHKTKDILHVMQLLGHRNIRNTLVYTHLVNWESDEFVCKVAKTVEEAKALVEDGFDYVTDVEGYKLFRKRK
jgi:integrase